MAPPSSGAVGARILDYTVSVVIPTKNAGADFAVLLAKLRAQTGVRQVEIVVVDSGSTDSTVDIAKRHGCRVVQIRSPKFSHSRARNLGAKAAGGDFILFTVQDALPAGDLWIHAFLSALLRYSPQGVVAATCREFPKMDADLLHVILMQQHYAHLSWGAKDMVTRLEEDAPRSLRKNAALNNVACLIRADILRRYPFRGYFGEDLDLGVRLIKDGHKLAFLSSVKVIHSHNRPPFYHLKRMFVDTLFMGDMFSPPPRLKFGEPARAIASVGLLFRIAEKLAQNASGQEPGIATEQLWEKICLDAAASGWAPAKIKAISRTPWAILRDKDLIVFLRRFHEPATNADRIEALVAEMMERFRAAFDYLKAVHPVMDKNALSDVGSLLLKISALVCGDCLGSLYRSCHKQDAHRRLMARMRSVLAQGI